MQNILSLETNKYAIKIENFEGPLDLLCHLIDKNKMNISDINLSEITDQYIDYINAMEDMNLEVTSEFILMASTLLYLKSKNLLPSQVEEEKELTEEELIRRIIEYKKYKEITKKFKELLRKFAAAGELDNYIERHTNYYTRVSVDAFQSSGISAVELICIHREEMRRGIVEKLNHRKVDIDDANHTDKPHN